MEKLENYFTKGYICKTKYNFILDKICVIVYIKLEVEIKSTLLYLNVV